MSKFSNSLTRIVVSLIYICTGVGNIIAVVQGGLGSTAQILTLVLGILLVGAGLFGLLHIKRVFCKICGIVLFVLAMVLLVNQLGSGMINTATLTQALIAWLFILCI